MTCLPFTVVCLALVCATAFGQESLVRLLERKLVARIEATDRAFTGVVGVAAIDLQTGALIEYNGNVVFPQASSIKIPILAELYQQAEAGKLDLDAAVTLHAADAVGGSGDLQESLKRGPVSLTVRQLLQAMIRTSDNTATNRLIAMASMDAVNRWIRDAGLRQTRLQRRMMDGQAAKENRENISTPVEMARIAEMLYEGKAVSPGASKEMIQLLTQVKGDFRAAVPAAVAVAAKPGDLTGVRAETGIIFLANRPFVLSVMSTFLEDGKNPIPSVTRLVYEHFEKLANSNRYGHKLQ